jgi:transcriptional regulator with XRE-family HTH domain
MKNQFIFNSSSQLISYLIELRGLNKVKFAEKLGVQQSQVTRWTKNKSTISRNSLNNIQQKFLVKIININNEWHLYDLSAGIRSIYPEPVTTSTGKIDVIAESSESYSSKSEPTKRQESSASRIKSSRVKSGLTQEELAEKLGLHKTAISKWETALATPSVDQYHRLAMIFKRDPTWLMALDQYPPETVEAFELTSRNISQLRQTLARIQAQGNLSEQDFETLHAAQSVLGHLLRSSES